MFLDGDGSDIPAFIPQLVEPIASGTHDFVIGSRTRGQRETGSMNFQQILSGRIAGWIMQLLYGVRYTDMCPFRAIRRDALAKLDMREETYGWNLEMQMKAARAGLRILEIPVNHRRRTGGESKVSGTLRGTFVAGTRIIATLFRVRHQPSKERCASQPSNLLRRLGSRLRFLDVASPMVSMLDLERFRATPLTREPFEFLIVPEFVKADARSAIHNDYPEVDRPGSFPLGEVTYGSAFAKLVEEMRSDEFRKAFEEKFGIDLTNRPDMITVRGRCSEKDGKIHTDSETKIITILIYMNAGWESAGGRLRLLRSGNNLDDMILEVPPTEGTLLAFRRSNNSWHGHKPFSGPRRVIQFNWVTSEAVVRREQNRHRFSAWMKKIRGALSGEKKAA